MNAKPISMKKLFVLLAVSSITFLLFTNFKATSTEDPAPMTLYDSIAMMDERWEDAYNHCKLDVMEEIISEDLEFFHDQGGLMTSKKKLNEALKTNICGKVTRSLKPGSLEVYPINGYGAVEMGLHAFHNSKEPAAQPHYSKFVHIWKRENGKWRITRVISLH